MKLFHQFINMNKKVGKLVVTMLGIGSIKYFPGTFASAITAIIYLYFYMIKVNYFALILINLFLLIYSIWMINNLEGEFDEIDSKQIVIDEFLGQSIPIYLYEISHGTTKGAGETFVYYFLFFILFRYFDIIKPFPVSFFDKNFKNSFGVIFDDVMAGFYVVITFIIFMIAKSKLF